MEKKYWCGSKPESCDICMSKISDMFIDGRTVYGPWANMCPACYQQVGVGLGTGKGQKYKLEPDTCKFYKVEG